MTIEELTDPAPAAQSLWSATAPPCPPLAALEGDLAVDVAVIGAGYTGLSAALHLAQAGCDAAVLDAVEPGFGASGRNGGQVIPGLKYDPDELERRYAPLGERLVHTVGSGPDLVYDLIERFGIDCAPVRSGWIQPAHTRAALGILEARAKQWARRGAEARLLGASEVAALIGSNRYVGGWLDGRGGTVQPLAYARGLARAALGLGARVYRDSPVSSLTAAPGGWRLALPRGSVAARSVILATNAYSGSLHDALRRSVVAVPSYQIATPPLSAAERRTILPGRQAVSDTLNLLRYFRLDPAGRLVMGARGLYGRRSTAEAMRSHVAAVREIFPQLATPRFDFQWGGFVAMTADHVPHLHELAPGLHAAIGYNGRGVAMATMLGRLVASRALGVEDPQFAYPTSPLRPLRLHAFSRLGVRATVSYLRLRDFQRSVEAGQ